MIKGPSTVAHTYNPCTLGGPGGWITRSQETETILANMVKPHLYKTTKISWAYWHMPVVPATREAEVVGSLETRGVGCSEPRSYHCTPAWVTEQDPVSKKNKNKKKKKKMIIYSALNTLLRFHFYLPNIWDPD